MGSDDESDAGPPKTPRQPESGWDVGGGWDIGQRAAVPMPYYVFPENKDNLVVCRNQEDFASAVHKPRREREARVKRHTRAMVRGHGSPSVGSPYAPLGMVADLEMPTRASTRESSRSESLRVVYPRPQASKGNTERIPKQLRLGRTDAGYAYEREYCHYMVIVPANRSLEVEVMHAEGASAPDVFACKFNMNPNSEAHTWRELGGNEKQVTLTIDRTDPALHPGALFIGVYSLHETGFLVSARVREDPLQVPALNAVGSRVRGKYDGYALIMDRVKKSNDVTTRVKSGATYATATDAVANPNPKPEARLAGSHSAPALSALGPPSGLRVRTTTRTPSPDRVRRPSTTSLPPSPPPMLGAAPALWLRSGSGFYACNASGSDLHNRAAAEATDGGGGSGGVGGGRGGVTDVGGVGGGVGVGGGSGVATSCRGARLLGLEGGGAAAAASAAVLGAMGDGRRRSEVGAVTEAERRAMNKAASKQRSSQQLMEKAISNVTLERASSPRAFSPGSPGGPQPRSPCRLQPLQPAASSAPALGARPATVPVPNSSGTPSPSRVKSRPASRAGGGFAPIYYEQGAAAPSDLSPADMRRLIAQQEGGPSVPLSAAPHPALPRVPGSGSGSAAEEGAEVAGLTSTMSSSMTVSSSASGVTLCGLSPEEMLSQARALRLKERPPPSPPG